MHFGFNLTRVECKWIYDYFGIESANVLILPEWNVNGETQTCQNKSTDVLILPEWNVNF